MKVSLRRIQSDEVQSALIECPPAFLSMLNGSSSDLPLSVLLTREDVPAGGDEIVLDPEQLEALVVGKPGIALLLHLRRANETAAKDEVRRPIRNGDRAFLETAEAHFSDSGLRDAASALLRVARALQPEGDLRAGEGRRFVNYPDNFVGFTVQRRNQKLLVHLRQSAASNAARGLKILPDRRPYIRVWVGGRKDIAQVTGLIRASFDRGR